MREAPPPRPINTPNLFEISEMDNKQCPAGCKDERTDDRGAVPKVERQISDRANMRGITGNAQLRAVDTKK